VTSAYSAARKDAAFLALAERGVLAVTGPDRQKFLHNLLSNDVKALAPGGGCLAALMDVKGHVLALLRVLVTQDAVLLELPQARRTRVEELLLHYKVAAPVRFAARPTAVLAVLGPSARSVLARAGCAVPELLGGAHIAGAIAGQSVLVARATDLPCGALVVHAQADAQDSVVAALSAGGAASLERSSFDALRIEEGRPLYGPDVAEDNLLHETGLVSEYHSPSKGCYVGQEVVARREARGGNVNKLLRGLELEAEAEAGAAIVAEGRDAGRVTSAAVSPRLGPIAMGYVHRRHAEPGTPVAVAGRPARVSALPMSV
jgi:folate-binding protein YgfZ